MIKAGTSTKGPITPAKACPEFKPKTAMATAIANSKLLPVAVKEMETFILYSAPIALHKKNPMKNIKVK